MGQLAANSLRQLTLIILLLPCSAFANTGIEHSTLQHNGRHMQLQISTEFQPAMRQTLRDWVDFLSQALLQAYGRWPRQQLDISITPVSAGSSEPIPWAQVHRGDIDRVEFFTASDASSGQLKQAWTGYHELAHLLIPYSGKYDAWFSEGLASYYQYVLQARAGVLSEQQAWQELYDGFQRGRADSTFAGQELQAASKKMRRDGGFMRVYWSGAWYFLAADTRLRQQSRGRLSLDTALEKLNACCADEQLSVPEMVARLDELNRVLLFQALYKQTSTSRKVPPFESIFASLGITTSNNEVRLQDEGPGAALRRGITRPKTL